LANSYLPSPSGPSTQRVAKSRFGGREKLVRNEELVAVVDALFLLLLRSTAVVEL